MAAVDYEKLLCENIWKCFQEELEKVKNGEVSRKELEAELKELVFKSQQKAETSEYFDIEKVNTLIAQSYFLLEDFEEHEKLVQDEILAAISYFINEDDAIGDDDLLEGYDDDYEVMATLVSGRSLGGPITK